MANKSIAQIPVAPFKLALFGRPVAHSLSPQIHRDFASQHGLAIEYGLESCTDSAFSAHLKRFFAHGAHGANVTLPFKAQAADCVDELSEEAALSGVVNTISVDEHGQLVGHNTDGSGFVRDLKQRQQFSLNKASVLVIGAGGAACGIIPSVLADNPARLLVANRSAGRLQAVLQRFKEVEAVPLERLTDLPACDLVINATSLGHQGLSPPLHKNLFAPDGLAYDLSYGSAAQPFLAASRQLGAGTAVDGLGMLVEQAALAFSLWFALSASTAGIYQQLFSGLNQDNQSG